MLIQMKKIAQKNNDWEYLSKKEMAVITYTMINPRLCISSKQNLLCKSCKYTCFSNSLGNEKCLFCLDSCQHFICKEEYKIEFSNQSMNFQDLFSNFEADDCDDLQKKNLN